MESFNIDTSFKEYSPLEIFYGIKHIIKKKDFSIYDKVSFIALSIKYITDERLLNKTIDFLKDCDWLLDENKILLPLEKEVENKHYTEHDKTIIKAFLYSSYLEYEVCFKRFGNMFNLPEFFFKIKGREVYSNINDVFKTVKKSSIYYVIDEVIRPLTPAEQKIEYKKLITSFSNIDYRNDSEYFDSEIKHLTILKNNIIETSEVLKDNVSNPHPRIFSSIYAFNVFERMHKQTSKNVVADYSFIYRKMVYDNLIYNTIGDSEFRKWLSSNYEIEIDQTKQLHNCTTNSKEHLYSTIKDSLK